MRDILVKVVNEGYEPQLRELRNRVLLLWGENDTEVPVAVAEAALRIIRQAGGTAELEVLPGVGHLVPTQAPEAIARVLAEELRLVIWALLAACLLAAIPAGLRWLRVAQREHYLAGAVATFAGRWWTSGHRRTCSSWR